MPPRKIKIRRDGVAVWVSVDDVELPAHWVESANVNVEPDRMPSVMLTMRAHDVTVDTTGEVGHGQAQIQTTQEAAG